MRIVHLATTIKCTLTALHQLHAFVLKRTPQTEEN